MCNKTVHFSSVTQSCLTICNPMDCSMPGLPVHHQLLELTQIHVHRVGDAIQPSHPVIPFSSCLQSFSASGSFPMSQLFTSGGESIGASASASVLPMNIQNWFPLGLTGKKTLVPWKKSYDQPRQHIKKQKHYFDNKGPSGQSYSFSISHVWMWELDCKESWAVKNWCFWTVGLEKTFESWTARRSNHSILKEISPEYTLEGLMLKLKLQYFGHLTRRTDSLVKTLMLGKIEGRRRREQQRNEMVGWHLQLDGHESE